MFCKYKKPFVCLLVCLLILCFNGCQKSPEGPVVINKNGALAGNGAETHNGADPSSGSTHISNAKEFSSTDESVLFHMELDTAVSDSELSVVEVYPYFFTGNDAEHIANVLFPDAEFFEAEPPRQENFSKSEIQAKIDRWTQYANMDALRALYGAASNDDVEVVKGFIERYTAMYDTAPETPQHIPCKWVMRKTSEYLLLESELEGVDYSKDNDEVSTQFTVDGIPYYLTVATRNKSDYKVNMVSCNIQSSLSPLNIDVRIAKEQLCRTEKPSQAQVDAAQNRAEHFLAAFNLGQWEVDECYVRELNYGDHAEYEICINAVPVLNNMPAIRHPQLASLRNENGYAPEQYYTDANFVFSPEGVLVAFNLYTPLDSSGIVTSAADTMDMEVLLEQAQRYLSLTDSYAFGFGDFLDFIDEEVRCDVWISEVALGLSRIKIPNSEDGYYYVPSLCMKGRVEYAGAETNRLYYVGEDTTLLVLNSIDGSLIDLDIN